MANTLDITAENIIIKFDKGATLKEPLYWLDDNLEAIDLTGYTAVMKVWDATVLDANWDLTTANAGLTIVTGTIKVGAKTINNAQAIQINQTDTLTDATSWASAVYSIELTDTGSNIIPFVKGTLIAMPEQLY